MADCIKVVGRQVVWMAAAAAATGIDEEWY